MTKILSPVLYCLILAHCFALYTPAPALCAENAQESAFEALGLLARPDETAEDILLRAHAGDAFAVALAVVGYDLGVHGFPKDRALSLSMSDLAGKWGAYEMRSFLNAFWLRDTARNTEDDFILLLAYCQGGKASPLLGHFKRAGVFDLERMLSDLSVWQDNFSKKGTKGYADLLKSHQDLVESFKKSLQYLRGEAESLSRPAAKGEDVCYDLDSFRETLFFAATTHDPEKARPDWDMQRAMARIEQLRQNKNAEGLAWADTAPETLLAIRLHNSGQAKEMMRRAHAGDVPAMRDMSRQYANGENGFPKHDLLSKYWLDRAARAGDVFSMGLLAYDEYASGHVGWAWAWAALAQEKGGQKEDGMSAWVLAWAKERLTPDVEKAAHEALLLLQRRMRLDIPPPRQLFPEDGRE